MQTPTQTLHRFAKNKDTSRTDGHNPSARPGRTHIQIPQEGKRACETCLINLHMDQARGKCLLKRRRADSIIAVLDDSFDLENVHNNSRPMPFDQHKQVVKVWGQYKHREQNLPDREKP